MWDRFFSQPARQWKYGMSQTLKNLAIECDGARQENPRFLPRETRRRPAPGKQIILASAGSP